MANALLDDDTVGNNQAEKLSNTLVELKVQAPVDAQAETPAVEEAETRTDTQVKVTAKALLDALV